MLGNPEEYEKMARAERVFWWYRILHRMVLDAVGEQFSDKDISIIDAGCGTGGLMLFLKEQGYKNIKGFDLSDQAIKYCQKRGLNVIQDTLMNILNRYGSSSEEIIITNDTLCFLDSTERINFIFQCLDVLKPEGLLILNLPALKVFRGTHDQCVGITYRFKKDDIKTLINERYYKFIKQIYWPFLLSPFIFFVRLFQRIYITMNPSALIHSDVAIPPTFVNHFFERITHLENRFLVKKPFGSSLFVVAQKMTSQ